MKKTLSIIFLLAFSFLNAQVTTTNLFNPWKKTGTNKIYTNTFAVGIGTASPTQSLDVRGNIYSSGNQTVSGAMYTGSLGIGSLPTSSLSSFQLVKGSGTLDIGSQDGTGISMWMNQSAPTTTNYNFYSNGTNAIVNGGSTARLAVAGAVKLYADATGVRIGSGVGPSATLDVTGTMSISSTSSLGGDLYMNGGTRKIIGDAALELYSGGASNLNLRTSSGSAIISEQFAGVTHVTTSTLGVAVTGSVSATGVIKTGSATIQSQADATLTTPSSSGTLANLSDALFSVHLFATVTNPADGTNYYFGNVGYQLSTTSTAGRIKLPYNCTLVGFDFDMVTVGASSTSETCTLSIAGSTNYTLSTAVTNTIAYSAINTNGLSQSFSANDVINAKLLSPTWATNPTAVYYGLTLWFVRRS